ncbi:uncharacterized protein LOC142802950 [Rhipicephalus microplus]|uniref:uncharacterized protein LOC142802950 n=1 Tax=Rhipicephalus microplus TaxID=6941 RepID=UPI003F6C621E
MYVERFELYTTVNEIAEAKKLHLFLSVIWEETDVTLPSLLLPKTPSTSSYPEVLSALKKHYSPRWLVVSERYHFNQRKQASQETVTEFVVQLKKLASICDFGAFLEQALRDHLRAGLHSKARRYRLQAMSDSELTCDRVCNTATAMEVAAKDAMEMVAENTVEQSANCSDMHWQSQSAALRWGSQSGPCTGDVSCNTTKTSVTQTKTICQRCGGQHAPVLGTVLYTFPLPSYYFDLNSYLLLCRTPISRRFNLFQPPVQAVFLSGSLQSSQEQMETMLKIGSRLSYM